MARPTPAPAPMPADDDDDFELPANPPKPAKAAEGHPVKPRGGQVPRRQASSSDTPERKGGKVAESTVTSETSPHAGQEASRQGGKVPSTEAVKETNTPSSSYEGRSKLGARIPDELKTRLKIGSALKRRTEESIVIEAVEQWLDQNGIPNT
jgi:hypothetical protein